MSGEVVIEMIFVRPSTDVAWFYDLHESEYHDFVKANFTDPGKFTMTNVVSSDGLTLMTTVVWTTKADYDEWMANEYLSDWRAKRKAYNLQNSIVQY